MPWATRVSDKVRSALELKRELTLAHRDILFVEFVQNNDLAGSGPLGQKQGPYPYRGCEGSLHVAFPVETGQESECFISFDPGLTPASLDLLLEQNGTDSGLRIAVSC